jgi:hypothetical protein
MIGPLDEGERPWRCSCGRTANIATRTCRRIQRKRASVAMSARFVRIVSRANSAMSARTAAADLPRGRSGRRGNGGPACRLRNDRLRTSACISNTVLIMWPRMLRASSISRPGNGDGNPALVIPGWCVSTRPGISRFRIRCFASPRNDKVIPQERSSPRLHQSRHGNHRPGTSRGN